MKTILAADIGGTNSRFAHFEVSAAGRLSLLEKISLPTGEFGSFSELLDGLKTAGFGCPPEKADYAAIAVPGPVERGVYAFPTNIPCDIDVSEGRTGAGNAGLLNDFVAQAFACNTEMADNARPILQGEAKPGETIAVVGAGTGLGHCALAKRPDGGYMAVPAEAGHSTFAFYGELERAFMDFALDQTGLPFLSGDEVVTGRGLSLIHHFFSGKKLRPGEVAREMNPESETAMLFSRFYGRAVKNYTLCVVAWGGVFIAGGVAAKNPYLVDCDSFKKEFLLSPAYDRLLASTPVHLILNEDSGLWGAAEYGLQAMRDAGAQGLS